MKLKTHVAKKGFTLLELVIVLGIFAVLAGGAIALMGGFGDTAKIQRAKTDIGAIKTAIKSYEILASTKPSTEQGLEALKVRPETNPQPKDWAQQLKQIPQDPWGNPYNYRNEAGNIILTSNGPDGQENTEDDITEE